MKRLARRPERPGRIRQDPVAGWMDGWCGQVGLPLLGAGHVHQQLLVPVHLRGDREGPRGSGSDAGHVSVRHPSARRSLGPSGPGGRAGGWSDLLGLVLRHVLPRLGGGLQGVQDSLAGGRRRRPRRNLSKTIRVSFGERGKGRDGALGVATHNSMPWEVI